MILGLLCLSFSSLIGAKPKGVLFPGAEDEIASVALAFEVFLGLGPDLSDLADLPDPCDVLGRAPRLAGFLPELGMMPPGCSHLKKVYAHKDGLDLGRSLSPRKSPLVETKMEGLPQCLF